MQVSLLRSHAAGVGPSLPDELVRAMLLLPGAPSPRVTPGFGSRWCNVSLTC